MPAQAGIFFLLRCNTFTNYLHCARLISTGRYSVPKLKTINNFISDAIKKHGSKYDYKKVIYVNNGTKVEIVCPKHGSFWITPASHTSTGRGCAECNGGKQRTQEQFLEIAKQAFPHFIYNKVIYKNSFEKVEIVCPQHGSFFILPARLLSDSAHGCQKCAEEKLSEKAKAKGSLQLFIENAKKAHGDKYDYSKSQYLGSSEKINITCPEHGDFLMVANNHTSKQYGCPKCSNNGKSKEEKEVVDWLRTVYTGEIVENSRSIISPKELDIYLPEKRFAIEYNGLYWHSGDRIDKKAHLNKTVACKQQDIKLFHIFSDEWRDKRDIVKSMILYRIGMVGRKIPARKCELVVLDKNVGRNFFINTHISGDNRAQVYVGLKYGDEIVCAISMKKPIQKKYGNILEIARFSNALNTTVQGGFGKLFGYIKEYSKQLGYSGILTYADRRFGDGDTYSKNGFLFLSSSPVDYWYSDGIDRHFRFKYRAQKPLTEKQVAEQNGVFPVFGCGSNTYLYNF